MASLGIPSRTLCVSCLRRTVRDEISSSLSPFHRQLRGKKKSAKKATTIKVKLLEDMPGYGRKGTITPVAPGRMRNEWYPRQKAEYVTTANLHGVKPQAIVAERDFRFGLNSKEEEVSRPGEEQVTTAAQKGEPGEVPVKRISPKRTTELIEALVPNPILFYKTPIQEPEPQPEDSPSRPRRATSGAAADLDAASKPLTKPAEKQLTTIFGAVSTADIAESIRGLLATTEEAARVTLGADDIKILQQESKGSEYQATGIEGDRLKALGDFEVEVRVKGGSPVKRTVSVQAQEIAPEQ